MLRILLAALVTFGPGAWAGSPNMLERAAFEAVIDPSIDIYSRRNLRHIKPVNLLEARGTVRDVYSHCAKTFAPPAEPFLLMSPSPEALLGFWLISYESFVPDQMPRSLKEVVAVTISESNHTPYCEQAHRSVGLSTGDRTLANAFLNESFVKPGPGFPSVALPYQQWAISWTGSPKSEIPEAQMPELAGVTLVFHYVNRLVNAFTIGPVFQTSGKASFGDLAFRRMAMWRVGALTKLKHPPFAGIRMAQKKGFRPGDRNLSAVLGVGRVREAFATWMGIMDFIRVRLAKAGISEPDLSAIEERIRHWNPSEGALPLEGSPAVRFALEIATHEGKITDSSVRDLRVAHGASDRTVVNMAAWAAYLATMRIAERMD